jgi:hypothetical protein
MLLIPLLVAIALFVSEHAYGQVACPSLASMTPDYTSVQAEAIAIALVVAGVLVTSAGWKLVKCALIAG